MTRKEHLQWCKDPALAYARQGDATNTIASMISDLGKHPETETSIQVALITSIALGFGRTGVKQLVDWVEGFN